METKYILFADNDPNFLETRNQFMEPLRDEHYEVLLADTLAKVKAFDTVVKILGHVYPLRAWWKA